MCDLAPQFDLTKTIRPNILALVPYRCARDDYDSGILLDANENALGSSLAPVGSSKSHAIDGLPLALETLDLHRYPSPLHIPIKQALCDLRNSSTTLTTGQELPLLTPEQAFLGVGSDEVIDLLFRISCKPGDTENQGDRVLICPPTYGMYSVTAQVNDVGIVKVDLDVEEGRFVPQLELIDQVLKSALQSSRPIKLLFLTSPGNPSGTLIPLDHIRAILRNPHFHGLLVIDEAYIDFSPEHSSAVSLVRQGFPNLVVLQTLSKGFGLAAIRLGIAFAHSSLIQLLNNTKAPYTIGTPTAVLALKALTKESLKITRDHISRLIVNRQRLLDQLPNIKGLGQPIGSNHANFIIIPVLSSTTGQPDSKRAQKVYKTMAEMKSEEGSGGVVVRFRGNEVGCRGCLRITVGSEAECEKLLELLPKMLDTIA